MTKRNRFYLLIALVAMNIMPEKAHADYYTTEHENQAPGEYLISEGGNIPVCASQAGTVGLPAYLCVPSKYWGDRDAIRGFEENCQAETPPSDFYQANYTNDNRVAYADVWGGSYLICTKDNGWKYVDTLPVPNPCSSSNCSSGDWTSLTASNGASYQSKADRYCASNILCSESSPQLRCGTGYYGSSDYAGYGCSSCPKSPDYSANEPGVSAGYKVSGRSKAGATSIAQCYIPYNGGSSDAGYIDSNGVGTYQFTDNCYWS